MKKPLSFFLLCIATKSFALNSIHFTTNSIKTPVIIGAKVPPTLFYFNAGWTSNDMIGLDWKIINESAGDSFLVQKSTDNITFKTIGKVKCNGITGIPQYYSFTDSFPAKENNRYRLKIMGGGHTKYSPIVFVTRQQEGWNIAKVFPLPFNSDVSLQLMSDKKLQVLFEFTDLVGNLILTRSVNCINGTNMIVFDQLGHLPSGMYNLRVTAGKSIQQKLLKAH